MDKASYIELLNSWQIAFAELDETVQVAGSPERAAERGVVRDTAGARWILERIENSNLARKQDVAEQLAALSALKQIHPYCKTASGSFFQTLENKERGSASWMLRPYVEGVPLRRPGYLDDLWRMDAMADFLLELRQNTSTHPSLSAFARGYGGHCRPPLQGRGLKTIPSAGGVRDLSSGALAKEGARGGVFSICAYASNRMEVWRGRYSKLADKLEASFQTLETAFFPVHDQLPVAFCHGDVHPLNMIWGTSCIRSVIDWEFCGTKPELYDAALLVGCIGFEDPDNLIKEPVIRLVQRLRAAGFGAEESWAHFLELIAMIRFGWMSEWIRRRDREARKMEAVYIDLLVDQCSYIMERIF